MPDLPAVFLEVGELLREFAAPRETVTMDTALFVDLGLFGDDAAEFLEAFGRRLHVDLSMLRFDSHFLPEGHGCLEAILMPHTIWRRYFVSGRKKVNLIPITVRQLVEAATIGRWPAEWSQVPCATDP